MGLVAEDGPVGRASDGQESQRREGALGERSKPPGRRDPSLPAYLRTVGIAPLFFLETKVSLVKTRATRSLVPSPVGPAMS